MATPNATTRKAMAELEQGRGERLTSPEDLFEDLDASFRAKVREALADTRPAVPHQQVMDEAQALIDRKRRARP